MPIGHLERFVVTRPWVNYKSDDASQKQIIFELIRKQLSDRCGNSLSLVGFAAKKVDSAMTALLSFFPRQPTNKSVSFFDTPLVTP
jgi:hypothetical protein